MASDLTTQKTTFTLDDIRLPEGHIIVTSGEGGYETGWPINDADYFGRIPGHAEVILAPQNFRVVPREMVDERRHLIERHEAEWRAFAERVRAMPQIHVEVSVS